jgi:hypothetical protein
MESQGVLTFHINNDIFLKVKVTLERSVNNLDGIVQAIVPMNDYFF